MIYLDIRACLFSRFLGYIWTLSGSLQSPGLALPYTQFSVPYHTIYTLTMTFLFPWHTEQERQQSGDKDKSPVKRAPGKQEKPSELNGVLDSLNKLADLENRITSLEKDNVYERMVQVCICLSVTYLSVYVSICQYAMYLFIYVYYLSCVYQSICHVSI